VQAIIGDLWCTCGMTKRAAFRSNLLRDHARPRHQAPPTVEAIDALLRTLIHPVTLALVQRYHELGLRERVLQLPVMTALVLAMVWRQLAGTQVVVETLAREGLLWAEPVRVSAQALNQRLRVLPASLFAELFARLVPTLLARAAARQRPVPPEVARLQRHYPTLRVLDSTVLEPVFRKVGLLSETTTAVLGGTVFAVLDLPSKLPVQLVWEAEAVGNDLRFVPQVLETVEPGTFLLFDLGFTSFAFYASLTERQIGWLTRAKSNLKASVVQTLRQQPGVRDQRVRIGVGAPTEQVVRLIAVLTPTGWRRYLTNVLDPAVLSAADAVALYGLRWRLEDAFLLVKRLLGLSYIWTGAANGIQLQCWATWLLYAVLIDLCDAIAEELDEPLDRISVEMVYRSLSFFCGAYQRGEATDPVAYLAAPAQASLGIVKKRRPKRERERLARLPPTLT
jgi:hypothetical protein